MKLVRIKTTVVHGSSLCTQKSSWNRNLVFYKGMSWAFEPTSTSHSFSLHKVVVSRVPRRLEMARTKIALILTILLVFILLPEVILFSSFFFFWDSCRTYHKKFHTVLFLLHDIYVLLLMINWTWSLQSWIEYIACMDWNIGWINITHD